MPLHLPSSIHCELSEIRVHSDDNRLIARPRKRIISMLSRIAPRACVALLVATFFGWTPEIAAAPMRFHLNFDPGISTQPFTGRIYVMLFEKEVANLQPGPNWFRPEPFYVRDVKDWKPGQVLTMGVECLGYPVPMDKIPPGVYSVQAVMDFGQGLSFSTAPGNGYSQTVRREIDPVQTGVVSLKLDRIYRERPFVETERVKLIDIESKNLTAFHGKSVHLRAGVVLPASWASQPQRRYPIVYEVPGFSGNHFMAFGAERRQATNVAGEEMIWVVLDPNCPLGHHVFADSANNGPYGQALIEELIPALEKKFRGLATPQSRFLTGHSSGGWSSLWLQVTYPDFFNGVWSTAPDPVDFRDFQRIDLYKPNVNMFVDGDGQPRPIARAGNKPALWYKGFSDMEEVMGHGGQLASFEAVFSERGADDRPRRLWDRKTGAVDAAVAKTWENYDIRLVLERNWKPLGPKLAGKIHVYMGDADTFYLEGATKLLKKSLAGLGSDAVVELFPERHHGNLIDPMLRARMNREMAERFRVSRPLRQAQ